jgi:predicted XRE-type DNA-binding protein
MRRLQELARARIKGWLAANPRITQIKLAEAVGMSQTWVSQYKSGEQDADCDQLAAMAAVFGHTLSELFGCWRRWCRHLGGWHLKSLMSVTKGVDKIADDALL